MHRSLTRKETDACPRRQNSAKALKEHIKVSEHLVKKQAAATANARFLAEEQPRAILRLAELCESSSESGGAFDDDPPP